MKINQTKVSSFLLKGTIVVIFFFHHNFAYAYKSEYEKLSKSFRDKWISLLHYEDGRSVINSDSNFFLSSRGNTDPALELLATIDFFDKKESNQCFYPARYYLIYGKDVYDECTEFNDFKRFVSAEKVSVIFASESVSSPVSSMGHALMLLEGKNSYGLTKAHSTSFVADSNDNPNLFFQFLSNSIVGQYTLNPYNDAIYQYVSEEERTLWEYELELNPNEKKWLMLHLFELKSHKIKYSFFTHNCANGVSKILEVASNSFKFDDKSAYTTPIEYVKKINNETDRVIGITLRPSVQEKELINKGYDLNPLKSPETLRFGISYYHMDIKEGRSLSDYPFNESSYNSSYIGVTNIDGLEVSFLPIISDIREEVHHKRTLNESKFLELIARGNFNSLYLREVNIINITSLSNVLTQIPKVNFGISLNGDIDSMHTSLYPDIHVGSGISLSDYDIRPFYMFDIGSHINHHGINMYFNNTIGMFVTYKDIGRVYGGFTHVLASQKSYRNYKNTFEVNYSKNVFEDIWFNANYKMHKLSNYQDLRELSVGINYRF